MLTGSAVPPWLPYAFIPLLLWRFYTRIRRNMGRQVSKAWRHWLSITLFPVLIALMTLSSLSAPLALTALWGGLAFGAALGFWGLKLTRFEHAEGGFFFTPNAYLGVGLSLLFIGRVLYRMTVLFGDDATGAATNPDFARSPLTLVIFGLVAGYYTTYAAGLLRWRAHQNRASTTPPLPVATAASATRNDTTTPSVEPNNPH